MKIEPEEFSPSVWQTIHEGKPWRILICSKRFCRGPESPPTWVLHPVAILLSTPCVIHYPLRDDCHLWEAIPLEKAGLTRRTAQTALAEAWRGVESATRSFPDGRGVNFTADVPSPLFCHPKQCAKPQDKTMLRNVNAWLRWHGWDKRGVTVESRAHELTAMGFQTTTKALTRAAEERGL